MFVKYIAPFGDYKPGDVVEVPDGASVNPRLLVPCDPSAAEPITPPVS